MKEAIDYRVNIASARRRLAIFLVSEYVHNLDSHTCA
jgi:hypothetical protein